MKLREFWDNLTDEQKFKLFKSVYSVRSSSYNDMLNDFNDLIKEYLTVELDINAGDLTEDAIRKFKNLGVPINIVRSVRRTIDEES